MTIARTLYVIGDMGDWGYYYECVGEFDVSGRCARDCPTQPFAGLRGLPGDKIQSSRGTRRTGISIGGFSACPAYIKLLAYDLQTLAHTT